MDFDDFFENLLCQAHRCKDNTGHAHGRHGKTLFHVQPPEIEARS